MQDLPLEIGGSDHIRIDEPQPTDARRRQIERGGRAERAAADKQDGSVFQAQLPGLADRGDEQMSRVTEQFRGSESVRHGGGIWQRTPGGSKAENRFAAPEFMIGISHV